MFLIGDLTSGVRNCGNEKVKLREDINRGIVSNKYGIMAESQIQIRGTRQLSSHLPSLQVSQRLIRRRVLSDCFEPQYRYREPRHQL